MQHFELSYQLIVRKKLPWQVISIISTLIYANVLKVTEEVF